MKTLKLTGAALVAASAAFLGGCAHHERSERPLRPTLSVRADRATMLNGETATCFATTRNALGYHARVHWTATHGRIRPFNDNRMAHFTATSPGTARIVVSVTTKHHGTLMSSAHIIVNQLR